MKIAIISVTNQGDHIAEKINEKIPCTIFNRNTVRERGIKNIVGNVFNDFDAIIFMSSTGIAVRSIAGCVKSKVTDPAVLVIDASAKYVISLLSGHIGGANELTEKISNIIQAQPIITTATDSLGVVAPDVIAREHNLVIDSMKDCKDIAALIVEGKKMLFIDEDGIIATPKGYVSISEVENISKGITMKDNYHEELLKYVQGAVIVTNKLEFTKCNKMNLGNIPTLKLIRKNIILGIGCRKDYDSILMSENVRGALEENNIHQNAVIEISTVEIKAKEKAILDLADEYKCNLKIHTIDEISKVEHLFEGSDFVRKTIGVSAVSDPCVYLSGGEIFHHKTKMNGMTLSIGRL